MCMWNGANAPCTLKPYAHVKPTKIHAAIKCCKNLQKFASGCKKLVSSLAEYCTVAANHVASSGDVIWWRHACQNVNSTCPAHSLWQSILRKRSKFFASLCKLLHVFAAFLSFHFTCAYRFTPLMTTDEGCPEISVSCIQKLEVYRWVEISYWLFYAVMARYVNGTWQTDRWTSLHSIQSSHGPRGNKLC